MSSGVARTLWGCVLFSMFGLCTEIVFTGLGAGRDESFRGQVSLLMVPVYTFVYLVAGPLLRAFQRHGLMHLSLRLPVSVALIYAVEWTFGATYRAVGLTPWRYDHGWASAFSGGLVTLYYLPAWILFALIVVPVWKTVHAVAAHLPGAAGRSIDERPAMSEAVAPKAREESPLEVVELRNETLRLRFVPGVGGSVTDLSVRRDGDWVALMRRASEPLERSSHGASFTLAPYSNRLRDGRFRFEGQEHVLRGAEKHAIHGDVRDRAWRTVRRSDVEATLELDAGALPDLNFPFPFTARIRYALDGPCLHTELDLINTGPSRMPAGGGFHPYFNRAVQGRDECVELQFEVAGVYPAGDPPLPTGPWQPVPAEQDFSTRRKLDVSLDHCFGGWKREATLHWPGSGVTLRMRAGETLGHVILYSPPGEPFFALEPVVNVNDGFNLMAQGQESTGVVVLEPGHTLRAEFSLTVEG